jgi:hypothetical protein
MSELPDIEYTVILVFPGFGEEREYAEQVVEDAIQYLNTQKDEPGFRFAQNVFARLEMVSDAEQAHARLEADDDLAMMILHGLSDEERTGLTADCAEKGVPVCHTVEAAGTAPRRRRSRDKQRRWQVVFRKADPDEPRAHKIAESTLTAPPEGGEEEWGDRVGQLIAVMALGVMEFHWTRHRPRYDVIE